jgi:hypothetical protein
MKKVLPVVLAAMCVATARADWKDLKQGMDRAAVLRAVGTPLLENKGRSVAQVWTFDAGGYVIFEGGRATFWEQPKPMPVARPKPVIEAKTSRPSPKANVLAKS